MAYTPINWQTGDTITADKLNKMDNGWGVESTQLFSETVTTSGSGMYRATLAYSDTIDAASITVTFDGTEYTCSRIDAFGGYYYGGFTEQGPTFTEYPFTIMYRNAASAVFTETASTHTIAVAAPTLQTSSDFDAARGWSYDAGGTRELFSETVTSADDGEGIYTASLAYSQLITANNITVTYDGTEYECPSIASGAFGAPWSDELNAYDFSEFPFSLFTESGSAYIITQTAGEHSIAVVANVAPSAEVSAQFATAVGATGLLPFRCVPSVTTYAEMRAAADAGRLLYFYIDDNFHLVIGFNNEASDTAVTAYPEGVANVESFGFNSDMVFTVFTY